MAFHNIAVSLSKSQRYRNSNPVKLVYHPALNLKSLNTRLTPFVFAMIKHPRHLYPMCQTIYLLNRMEYFI